MMLDRTFLVEILQKSASNIQKETYVPFYGFRDNNGNTTNAVRMNMQPASKTLIALSEGVVGKLFTAFTTASGVVETMRLTCSGTNEQYIVRGREIFNYGMGQHFELVCARGGV